MNPRLAMNGRSALNYGDDARAEERDHLKLALATFALQLDAFERQTHRLLLGNPGNFVPPPDSGSGSREDDLSDG
jgi:hypothetical protein